MTDDLDPDLDLASVLRQLSGTRPAFHSEADFQHALAWQLQLQNPDAAIRLETRPERGVRLDVLVRIEALRYALELKYLVARTDVMVEGEHFDLPSQSAHDISRYDVCKDVVRCERMLRSGYADRAYVIVLANDGAYWRPGIKEDPIDLAFRLQEGRELTGTLAWGGRAGAGTMRGREEPLVLGGHYRCVWQPYSELQDSRGRAVTFRYLLLEASGEPLGTGTQGNPPQVATESAPRPVAMPVTTGTTAREQVLRAAKMLHSRGITTFTPAQIVAVARSQGATAADVTLRTHISSYMIANIDTEHGGRWPDLVRVKRGLYRLADPPR